jgi:hypothetical protein
VRLPIDRTALYEDLLNGTYLVSAVGAAGAVAGFVVGAVSGTISMRTIESSFRNFRTASRTCSVVNVWKIPGNPYAKVADPAYPHVLSTYRLTEHHLSGVMSRWLPWLAELMPELFCEISPEHAEEIGVKNTEIPGCEGVTEIVLTGPHSNCYTPLLRPPSTDLNFTLALALIIPALAGLIALRARRMAGAAALVALLLPALAIAAPDGSTTLPFTGAERQGKANRKKQLKMK